MNLPDSYYQTIYKIIDGDSRYPLEAYLFVQEAVSYSLESFHADREKRDFHLNGHELLDGIRLCVLDRFGAMAHYVFREWGITRTEDFGNIVFNMIDHNLLHARPEDSIKDFANGYDFEKEFRAPFTPEGKKIDIPVIT